MGHNMWGELKQNSRSNFPEDLIKEQFDLLTEMTAGSVIGRVEQLDRGIDDLTTSPLAGIARIAQTMQQNSRIQDILGESGEDQAFTYEVYLTGKNTPGYKYRFMILQHGISPYPVRAVIEQAIADDFTASNPETDCSYNDEHEFQLFLSSVLGSQRVMNIVNGLLAYQS